MLAWVLSLGACGRFGYDLPDTGGTGGDLAGTSGQPSGGTGGPPLGGTGGSPLGGTGGALLGGTGGGPSGGTGGDVPGGTGGDASGGTGGDVTGGDPTGGTGGDGTGGTPGTDDIPVRSEHTPSISVVTTDTAYLGLYTDVAATCRYATSPGVSYASMPDEFATTGGTFHQQLYIGLVDDTAYSFYVRCRTSSGMTNSDDYLISFFVDLYPEVFRSVGPGNTSALASGTGMSITGGIATFPVDLPDNVGVGDMIQYDAVAPAGPDTLAMIIGRVDARRFAVRTPNAAPLGDVSGVTWSVFRAYTGLTQAFNLQENTGIAAGLRNFDSGTVLNTVSRDRVWNIACYADAVEVANVRNDDVVAWVTGPNHPVVIFTPVGKDRVGVSQRHNGAWTAGAYTLQNTNTGDEHTALRVFISYLKVDGLQIDVLNHGPAYNLGMSLNPTGGGLHEVTNTIVRGHGSATGAEEEYVGVELLGYQEGSLIFTNNVVYGFRGSANAVLGLWLPMGDTLLAVNNTIGDSDVCVGGGIFLVNNILTGCGDPLIGWQSMGAGSGYNATDSPSWSGTAVGPGNRTNVTFSFVSAATNDYRLSPSDTGAVDMGTSSEPLVPARDIQGQPRTGAVDVGADERVP